MRSDGDLGAYCLRVKTDAVNSLLLISKNVIPSHQMQLLLAPVKNLADPTDTEPLRLIQSANRNTVENNM
jgi:hypothetical protein